MKKLLLPLLIALGWCGHAAAQTTYLGDYLLGDTVRCPWSTYKPSTGDSIARATAGTAVVYVDNGAGNGFNTAEFTTGLTDTSGFDGKTGEHTEVVVGTSANGFAVSTDYAIMIQGSTITDTGTVTFSAWPCTFSIENRSGSKNVIKDRGALSGSLASTTTTIQLGAKVTSSNIWNGMVFRDLNTKEQALICATTDSGSADTLTVAGLVTAPGLSDSYQIVWNNLPGTCLNAPPGSGLPLVDANGGVTVSHAGSSGATAPAWTDKMSSNLNTTFDNGNATFSGTISAISAAAIGAFANIGTPLNTASGATLAANVADMFGAAHVGVCDGFSTPTTCNNTSLTEADNFWNGWTSIIVANQPPRCVRLFTNSSHRLTFAPALPNTAASQLFVLRADPTCRTPP
jgi:hypothetical protein